MTNESTAEFNSTSLQLHRVLTLRSNGGGYYEVDEKVAEARGPGARRSTAP